MVNFFFPFLYRYEKADLHGGEQDAKESANASEEIEFVEFPDVKSFVDVDKSRKSWQDYWSQDGHGSVVQELC